METALCWSIHAKNSLSNVHGFTPYQLAIGYTPKLPCNLFNDPPAMETSTSSLVAGHLSAIAAAREAFVKSESSERVRRALRHNRRPHSDNKFYNGDVVYYKRKDCRKWKGPGRVIGHESQQVLVKHGGCYVRVHPCRLMLEKSDHHRRFKGSSTCSGEDVQCQTQNGRDVSDDTGSDEENSQSSPQRDSLEGGPDSSEQSNLQVSNQRDVVEISQEEKAEVEQSNSDYTPDSRKDEVLPKKGMDISFLPSNSTSWKFGQIHSRAGKASGKYRDRWNVLVNDDIKELDLGDLQWKESEVLDASDAKSEVLDVSDEVIYSEVFLTQVDEQTLAAKLTELENWKCEEVFEEVKDCGQETISVRWVVTPKLVDGKWTTKARLVARGFEDRSEVRTDSPTCMRETLKVVLAIAASKDWKINSIDIKAAFLQGKSIDREIFLRPPKEADCTGKLWLLKKVVYGLPDASRIWYLTVFKELTGLGVHVSKIDKAMFMWKKGKQIDGILVVHVDDFLWCGSEEFYGQIILPMKSVFKISKESEKCFRYLGVDLFQGEGFLTISQKFYIQAISEIELKKEIPDKLAAVGEDLHKEYRRIVGQLSWAAGITRPDAAYNACTLSTAASKPTYKDIIDANKAIRDLKSCDVKIKFPKLDLARVQLNVHADASFANLRNGSSQGGCMVFLEDSSHKCAPIAWYSKKINRVVRSTLGAETLSAVAALDEAYLVQSIVGEILEKGEIKINLHTDNKNLHDAIYTTNLVTDKRLRVDISALREMYERGEVEVRWISSEHQLADCLTKKGASRRKLLQVLLSGRTLD